MKKKTITIWISVIWVLMALLAVAGVTYAWFTFNPATNVTPLSSTISDGDICLLIATDPEAEFKTETQLPQSVSGDLEPVSTVDLVHFYRASTQTRQGISVLFQDATNEVDTATIHGTLYLKSLKDGCQVYFNKNGMDFGNDPQMLASLRLGMRFTTVSGTTEHVFSLNDMGDVSGATAITTTAQTSVVVGSVNTDGSPNYVADPAIPISECFAVIDSQRLPRSGRLSLGTINADEIAIVEYWLYLEGCDENCINAVQEKEAGIRLSFAGVTRD